MESDGFVLVKPSRKRKIKSKKFTAQSVNQTDESDRSVELDLGSVIQQVSSEGKQSVSLVRTSCAYPGHINIMATYIIL